VMFLLLSQTKKVKYDVILSAQQFPSKYLSYSKSLSHTPQPCARAAHDDSIPISSSRGRLDAGKIHT
jgi:hypothetical protein